MGSSSPIVHGSLLARLGRFYPATVTIQQATTVASASGELSYAWADLAGHIALACWVAFDNGRELKRADGTVAVATHKIAIAGYHASILPTMRAVSGGVIYDILAVAHDSQGATTSLICQVVV